MRPHRTRLVALVGAALLAAPPAAGAQGAVDEQYRDPFAGQGDGGSDTGEPAPPGDDAPSTAPAGGAPAAAPAPAAGTASATPAELPRTGAPSAMLAAAALALVAAGMTLRRRLR